MKETFSATRIYNNPLYLPDWTVHKMAVRVVEDVLIDLPVGGVAGEGHEVSVLLTCGHHTRLHIYIIIIIIFTLHG